MTSLAEQLMAGPRGRRVCLGAVSFVESDVSRLVFDLRFLFDATSVVRFGVGTAEREPLDRDSAMIRLRDALSGVHKVDDHFVRLALEVAVEGAMYWQEPDGMEVLASRPEIASEVDRIAGLVASSPTARWWMSPVDADQHQVRFLPVDHVAALDGPAEVILADAYRRRDVREPPGYLTAWWSVPPFGLVRTCSAAAEEPSGLYLVEDGYGQIEASVHRVRVEAPRVFEIDSGEAWAQLCRSYAVDATESKSGDWYRTTDLAGTRWVMPDWAAVASEYDAVHLQVGAYLAASGTAIEVEPGVHSVIAGWAPGDTYWLTDVVEVDPVGRIFVKDQDDDLWHPTEET